MTSHQTESLAHMSPQSLGELKAWLEPWFETRGSKGTGGANAGTSFPVSPSGGDEYVYVADATNGVFWRFRYYTTGTYWAFTGGPPLFAEVATDETCTSTSYANLATTGPAIVLPFAGDFDVAIGFTGSATGDLGEDAWMSYAIGGTGAADADGVRMTQDSTTVNVRASGSRPRRKAGLAAVTLTAKYKAGSGTSGTTFGERWMSVLPVKK